MMIMRKNVFLSFALAVTICLTGGLSASAAIMEFASHTDVGIGPIAPGTPIFNSISDLSSTDAAQGITPTIRVGDSALFGSDAFLTNGEWTADDGATDGAIYAAASGRGTPAGENLRTAVQIDLGRVIQIREINVFSRHLSTRLRQEYNVFGSAAATEPSVDGYPSSLPEWTLLDRVDSGDGTNNADGVVVTQVEDPVGSYRFLLFDIQNPAHDKGPQEVFGRETNYQEIDVHEIPEPATLLLAGLGLSSLLAGRRRK